MSFAYNWSLGTTLFRRKMSSSLRIVAGIFIATLIAIAAVCAYFQAKSKTLEHASYISLSMAMSPDYTYSDVESMAKDIRMLSSAVQRVHILTPDSVRAQFNSRVRVDINEMLPTNPCPYILNIYFHPEEVSWSTLTGLSEELRRIEGVEGIDYNSNYVRAVFGEMDNLRIIALLAGALVCIIVCMLLYFSLRSEPAFSVEDVRVLHLLGAKRSVARTGSIARIALAALVGITVAAGLAWGVLAYTDQTKLTTLWNIAWQPISIGSLSVLLLTFLLSLRSVPKLPAKTSFTS